MVRPLRIEYPGAFFHVTARGNARQTIFHDDFDCGQFLSILTRIVEKYNWRCHALVLMDNHYHLLLETPDANLSRGMRQLNGLYAEKYHQRYGTVGHLFQGRFKAFLVEDDVYFLTVARYVVLNPIRAKMVDRLEDYRWSSFRATAGLEHVPPWLTVKRLLAQLGLAQQRNRVMGSGLEFGILLGQEQ